MLPFGSHSQLITGLASPRSVPVVGNCLLETGTSEAGPIRLQAILCSVLREQHRAGTPPSSPADLSRTLRTAERARASLVVLPSYKEPTVDALASRTDEGRERLRKATGSCLLSTDP